MNAFPIHQSHQSSDIHMIPYSELKGVFNYQYGISPFNIMGIHRYLSHFSFSIGSKVFFLVEIIIVKNNLLLQKMIKL